MVTSFDDLHVTDGDPVAFDTIGAAVTTGAFCYADGSTQDFDPDGSTTYVENGRPTRGEWYLDDNNQFCSFWPPSYRACYDLSWMVENGIVVGLRFAHVNNGARFDGRYQS